MSLCITSKAVCLYRICKHVPFSVNLSSSSALRTVDFIEGSDTHDSSYEELKSRMQNYATSGHLSKALETLNSMTHVPGKPTVNDYNSLMYCSLKSRNVTIEQVIEVYLAMKRLGNAPNAVTFNTLLNGMLSFGYLEEGFCVAKEMYHENGFIPSFTSLSKLLKKSLEVGNLADSYSVFEFMLRLDYIPTEFSLSLLISKLSKDGKIQKAYSVFYILLVKGCYYGPYMHNPILWALCKSGQSKTALQLLYLMKKKGVVHDVCSYTALIFGFGREGLWKDLFCCLDAMQSYGCKPNTITYTIVIKYFCDNEETRDALELLAKMEREGCEPDLTTYNIILRELCLQDRVEDISGLIQLIGHKGLSPNLYTYAALAGGLLKRGNVGDAYKLLVGLISKGCTVDVTVYNIYFHCLCHNNRSREALCLLYYMMIKEGFQPSNVSYNTILKGLCRDRFINEALDLLDGFEGVENGPDLVSFYTILSAACKHGNPSMIHKVLCRMKKEGVAKYNNVLKAMFSRGKFSDMVSLLKAMVMEGFVSNEIANEILHRATSKRGCRDSHVL
ncbi:hypothetical protein FNV43_RR06868 [Rhamnella rubrinervis]|uniref:PROP1-like PPR domain-containing protein n=1 Tax=Rhamnella rubrinervis TaxID=2594499 RepID=A0A8K0HFE2_9ROSA|nr:hypothetical protein FNV43_RR06868 [Rhamnella rubrinervis]